jgi:hypothetical protein
LKETLLSATRVLGSAHRCRSGVIICCEPLPRRLGRFTGLTPAQTGWLAQSLSAIDESVPSLSTSSSQSSVGGAFG